MYYSGKVVMLIVAIFGVLKFITSFCMSGQITSLTNLVCKDNNNL